MLPSAPRLAIVAVLLLVACGGGSSGPAGPSPKGDPTPTVIPAQGTATTLDIGNWNIEWFGDPSNGPTNEVLQGQNVRAVMSGVDADIWGLEEVVGAAQFQQLVSALPGYAGVLATDAVVQDGAQYYSDYSNTEQKVALVWKTSVATLLRARVICADRNAEFAGRPPVEFVLRVSLNGMVDTAVVIVLHAKAGSTADDWAKRDPASSALKGYLDATYPTQKVWVIGDWNDDVDTSIVPGKASPYLNFVNDAARYAFPTRALSLTGVASTTGFADFIDHQLATNEASALYVANSAQAFRADGFVPNFAATTTDHYPVLSRWRWGGGGAR